MEILYLILTFIVGGVLGYLAASRQLNALKAQLHLQASHQEELLYSHIIFLNDQLTQYHIANLFSKNNGINIYLLNSSYPLLYSQMEIQSLVRIIYSL